LPMSHMQCSDWTPSPELPLLNDISTSHHVPSPSNNNNNPQKNRKKKKTGEKTTAE
jgi:hypothetical protein